MKALGFIETKGLVPAIESADAMLKAAEVTLVERTFVKGGLVTITIAGDVAACKASVDAAASAVTRMGGQIISTHVIPRPHETLDGLIVKHIPGEGEEESEDD
ncbi:MAG: BMC domain-containing protein [Bacillota bacterium]|jgi:microcompartment protein CcmL/EutN|nr:BMC domain-containing protein [Bacillota bacterium]